ncbi:recombination associated protein RdgC [Roseateles asaccharophilus]|uniref:recombination-associated protein RdgC n=1 Tax=Roseateles asaccharophilus TaxID=582607 RepID=UPI0038383877
MFKQISVFLLDSDWIAPDVQAIGEALALARFVPCEPTQKESVGWIDPRGLPESPLVESIDGHLILKQLKEVKKLNKGQVQDLLDQKVEQIKKSTGVERVGTRTKKELKEQAEFELLPNCYPSKSSTLVWIDTKARRLVIGSSSTGTTDGIVTALIHAFSEIGSSLSVRPLQTKMSPAVAMADWLTTMEPPAEFTVDRECVLKGNDEMKATVRYGNHALDIQEIVDHIQNHGKMPKSLAMSFRERVSYVLGDDLSIKKISFGDLVYEGKDGVDANNFDGDVAIATAELSQLVTAMIEVLGGEHDFAAAEPAAAAGEPAVASEGSAAEGENPFEDPAEAGAGAQLAEALS